MNHLDHMIFLSSVPVSDSYSPKSLIYYDHHPAVDSISLQCCSSCNYKGASFTLKDHPPTQICIQLIQKNPAHIHFDLQPMKTCQKFSASGRSVHPTLIHSTTVVLMQSHKTHNVHVIHSHTHSLIPTHTHI